MWKSQLRNNFSPCLVKRVSLLLRYIISTQSTPIYMGLLNEWYVFIFCRCTLVFVKIFLRGSSVWTNHVLKAIKWKLCGPRLTSYKIFLRAILEDKMAENMLTMDNFGRLSAQIRLPFDRKTCLVYLSRYLINLLFKKIWLILDILGTSY